MSTFTFLGAVIKPIRLTFKLPRYLIWNGLIAVSRNFIKWEIIGIYILSKKVIFKNKCSNWIEVQFQLYYDRKSGDRWTACKCIMNRNHPPQCLHFFSISLVTVRWFYPTEPTWGGGNAKKDWWRRINIQLQFSSDLLLGHTAVWS